METITELGKFLISTTVLGGLIVWLFKEFFKLRFSRDLEKHKGEIDNYFYREKLKFSKLHEERAIVIKELYNKLSKYHQCLKLNLKDVENIAEVNWEDKKQNINNTFEVSNQFERYYNENKILLAPELCNEIELLKEVQLDVLKQILSSHLVASDIPSNSSMDERVDRYLIYEEKLKSLMHENISNIEKSLENEFRKILGALE